MAYSIYQDMTEISLHPERWVNHGRYALENNCKHYATEDKRETNIRYSGYCDKCGVSENSAMPMMNYLYPLELSNFSEDKVLRIVQETNCTILEDNESGNWYLALCGGGMDLSQDIALAYIIAEKWIPKDLLMSVCKQPLLSLGSKNYKRLAREIKSQLKSSADNFKQRAKEWNESLKELRKQERLSKVAEELKIQQETHN